MLYKVNCLLVLLLALAYYNYHSVNQALRTKCAEINTTARANQDILIFNRVPKVGSQTLTHLIAGLTKTNGFNPFTSVTGMPDYGKSVETVWIPNADLRKKAIQSLSDFEEKPFAFMRHIVI